MSWILILNSNINAKPPAVIGGYATREDAERAGDAATAFDNEPEWPQLPFYTNYVVIPGAACSEPIGSTLSDVVHSQDFATGHKIQRQTKRWP